MICVSVLHSQSPIQGWTATHNDHKVRQNPENQKRPLFNEEVYQYYQATWHNLQTPPKGRSSSKNTKILVIIRSDSSLQLPVKAGCCCCYWKNGKFFGAAHDNNWYIRIMHLDELLIPSVRHQNLRFPAAQPPALTKMQKQPTFIKI